MRTYNPNGAIYEPAQIDTVIDMLISDCDLIGNNKGERVYNIPLAFDIETSSFYRDLNGKSYTYEQVQQLDNPKIEKVAIMYIWQLGINGAVILGRTWGEFITVMNRLSERLELTAKKRLVIYVHNLSYEFQFIRNRFEWHKIFSLDARKPLYAITDTFIEFRCSYLLSGYSLANVSKQLMRYKVAKMVGDLDYSLVRHKTTPLTITELGYCINDVRTVMNYIRELIEDYKGLHKLPLTKTGFVRQYCRNRTLNHKVDGRRSKNWAYAELMDELQLSGLDELETLQRAFAGGFTHANAYHADEVLHEVDSCDFTSSYPSVMVAEQFPMSRGVRIQVKDKEHFEFLIQKYCCVFDIEFTNIFAQQVNDNPISVSKCFVKQNVSENNGRVVCATKIVTTITEIDYDIISKFYTWGGMRVGEMYCYKKAYLPTPFIKSVLELYEKKTKLKGVAGKESEYLNSKEMLNSTYGMCVTNPLREEFTYNGEWETTVLSDDMKREKIYKYNNSKNRFLFYAWGIYITAYARRNLFTAILTAGDDYVYSDTDSVKITNGDKYIPYFRAYNSEIENKLRTACSYHKLPYSLCEPRTIKGITKTLGVWDYEGRYTRFKTLGAKRYMVEYDGALMVNGVMYNHSLTVSGVNKFTAIPYLTEQAKTKDIFDLFSNYLRIPPEATGKNIHTYVDYEVNGMVEDYNGDVDEFNELSGVHLEPTGYSFSIPVMYLNYLLGIKFKE
jgi:hypothetical protein